MGSSVKRSIAGLIGLFDLRADSRWSLEDDDGDWTGRVSVDPIVSFRLEAEIEFLEIEIGD